MYSTNKYTSGSLTASGGTFTVNTSGTLELGGGSNAIRCTTGGTVNLTSGTIIIYGQLSLTTGISTINGANIFVDPNPSITGMFPLGPSSNTLEVTGTSGIFNYTSGSITLVNPMNAAGSGRDLKITSTGTVNISPDVKIYVGDGVSTRTSTTYTGFVNGSTLTIPNLTVQTGGIVGRNLGLLNSLTVNKLTMTSGNLILGAYDLTVLNPDGLTLTSKPATTGYIVTDGTGKFIQTVNPGAATSSSGVYPVGTSLTSYDPVKLVPAELATFAVNVGTTLPADAPAQYTYTAKVWDISVTGTAPSTTVTLTPSNPVSTVTSDVIDHYENAAYTNVATTRVGNDYTAVFTSFSPFVTGTYDVGTSVNQTTAIGIQFDGQTIYNPTKSGLKVYDATGKLTVNSTDDINMSSFPKGIYIIKSHQGTQKIILMK